MLDHRLSFAIKSALFALARSASAAAWASWASFSWPWSWATAAKSWALLDWSAAKSAAWGAAGAAAGMVLGGLVSGTAAMVVVLAPIDPDRGGWPAVLVGYPAAVSVPLAFLAMVLVSLATRRSVPADVGRTFSRMHVPERLGMGRDREIGAFGAGASGADKSVSGDRTRRSSR